MGMLTVLSVPVTDTGRAFHADDNPRDIVDAAVDNPVTMELAEADEVRNDGV